MTRSMNFDVTATDNAAAEFLAIAAAVEKLEDKLRKLDQRKTEPKIDANITPATLKINQLKSRLDALKNVRATVEVVGATEARVAVTALVVELRKVRDTFRAKVELQTGTATAELNTIAAKLAAIKDAKVKVEVTGTAKADLTAIAAKLQSLKDAKVKVTLDDAGFALQIARLHQRISALSGARVRIEFEINPPGIRAELEAIAAALGRIRNTRARVDVDTNSATTAVAKLGDALGKIGKGGAIALSIPGIINLVGQVASLGGELASLAGVLGLLPAAGLAAGAGIATVAIGLNGIADALGPTGTAAEIEKVAEAMERLSPAARTLVTEIRGLGPAWNGVRLEVQERLLAGLGAEVRQLGATYLPTLSAGLGGVATELNSGVKMWSDWAGSGPAVIDLNTILGNTRSTLRELAPAGTNVAAALTDISVVGSEIMPELAAGATAATGRFREFIAEARRTGELEQWIRGGIATLEQLGRIAGNTGGILSSVFRASETAGYGFLDAVEQITGELDTLLSSATGQNNLAEVFRASRDAINLALPGVRELSAAVLDMLGNFARAEGLREFATLVSQTSSAVSPLVAEIGNLAGDALGDLAGGASLAVAALSPLVGGTAAVADALGPVPGLVLASVVAFKGLGLATASIAALGARIAATAALTGTLTAGLTGSLAAGALAQGAMTRLGTAVSAVGRALPIVGVAAILAAAGFDALTTSSDEASVAIAQGGTAAARAVQDLATYGATATYLRESWGGLGSAMASAIDLFTTSSEEYKSSLDTVGLAQFKAAEAGSRYYATLGPGGEATAGTAAAQREYAAELDAVEAAQRDAEQATQSYSDRLRDQAAAAQSAIGANLQLNDALRRAAEAQSAANDAVREHGAGSEEAAAALDEFVSSADQVAQSAQRVAEGLGGADAGTAAYGATLLNMAAAAEGPARDALLGHVANLSDAQLQAVSAGAAALGFATQILTLPDGRTVTIAVDPETGKIVDTQTLLDGMRDGNVAVNLETQQALTELDALIGVVNGAGGSVNIDGNPMAAGVALQTVLGQIAAGAATVTINGQAVPASTALSMILNQIESSGATVTINGQNAPAAAVLRDTLGAIAAGQETVTINGQSVPARGALSALLRDVNLASAVISILGRDGGVQALKNSLSAPSSSTHTIYVRQMGALSIRDTSSTYTGGGGRAEGGYAIPMANGGILPPTRYLGRRLTPMAARAQVVPRNTWRVLGDNMKVPEAYIPLDGSARSLSYARSAVQHFGYDIAPRMRTSTSAGGSVGPAAGSVAIDIRRGMDVRRGIGLSTSPRVDLTPMLRELGALGARMDSVAAAVRDARPINVTSNSADPVEVARTAQWRLRMPS